MYHRIFIFLLCALFIGCTRTEETKSVDFSTGLNKDDIFIDDAQPDPIEGSAVAGEFSDDDEESSGVGPDDEDGFEGSASGSGEVTDSMTTTVRPVTPTTPLKKGDLDVTEDTEVKPRILIPVIPKTKPTEIPKTVQSSTPVTQPPSNELPDTDGKPDTPDKTLDDNEIGGSSGDNNNLNNEVRGPESPIMGRTAENRPTSFFSQPGILAAVIGGAVVGLLCAILLVMFIVYRMRKKDEGSYALDEPKRSPRNTSSYQPPNKEFYA